MRKRKAVVLKFGVSKYAAKQSFGPETDINRIMDRFRKTGELPKRPGNPIYADVSRVPGFHESQSMLIRANALFRAMPEKLRGELLANPGKFFAEHLGPAKPAAAPPPASAAAPGAPLQTPIPPGSQAPPFSPPASKTP